MKIADIFFLSLFQVANEELEVNLTSLSANENRCNVSEHENLANEIDGYKEKIGKLHAEAALLKLSQVAEKKEQQEEVFESIDIADFEIKCNVLEHQKLADENTAFREKIGKLQTEVALLKLAPVAEKKEKGDESAARQSASNIPEQGILDEEVAAYKEKIGKLETEVALLKLTSVAEKKGIKEDTANNTSANQDRCDILEHDELTNEIAAYKEKIGKLQAEVALAKLAPAAEKKEQKEEVATANQNVCSIPEHNELTNEIAAYKEKVGKLQAEVALAKLAPAAEKKEQKEEVATANQNVCSIPEHNELTNEIAAYKEKVGKLQAEVALLKLSPAAEKKEQKEVAMANQNVCSIPEHNELTNEIAAYKEKVGKLKAEVALAKLAPAAEKKGKKEVTMANQNVCSIPEHNELTNEIAAYKEKVGKLQAEVALLRLAPAAEKKAQKVNEQEEEVNLRQTISELEEDLEQARSQFEQAHEEFDEHDHELQARIKSLEKQLLELQNDAADNLNITLYEEKIEELEKHLVAAEENEKKLKQAEEERDQRVEELQGQLRSMEENEQKLCETIEDLKDIETSLKGKIVESEMDITEKVRLTEEREKLLSKVHELELEVQKLREPTSTSAKEYEEQISELTEKVEELTTRESELMKEVYEQKMENQELQDHLEEVMEEKSRAENVSEVEELRENLTDLQDENETLKSQVLKTKLSEADAIEKHEEQVKISEELQERIDELEKNEHDLKESCKKANAEIETLNVQLKEHGGKAKALLDKLEVLELSEGKLMEQLDLAEERNAKLSGDLATLSNEKKPSGSGLADDSKLREQELLDEIERLKVEMNSGLKTKEHEELRNKVEVLVEAEGKLVDRLQEQEEVELELQEKIKQLQREIDTQTRVEQGLRENLHQLESNSQTSEQVEMYKEDIKRLEMVETEQLAQITNLQSSVNEYESSIENLNQTISKLKHVENSQKHQISELEKSEKTLKAQISELETQKQELGRTLETEAVLKARIKELGSEKERLVSTVETLTHTSRPSPMTLSPNKELQAQDESLLTTASSTTSFVPLSPDQIQKMSREEMMSKIQELQSMEEYHRTKITHLTENLDELRNAVEVVAVTMETDAGIPVVKYRPKVKVGNYYYC